MGTWTGLNPPYRTIVADPPWPIRWNGGAGGRRSRAVPLRYSLMSIDDIAALPVASLVGPAGHLYLWVTARLNREGVGVRVARAWGFEVVGEIVWEKPNFGMGQFPRLCHEVLLIARRGDARFVGPADVRSVQHWPQVIAGADGKKHSAKPHAALDLVELFSRGPYVELFARTPRLGWDSWGRGFEEVPA